MTLTRAVNFLVLPAIACALYSTPVHAAGGVILSFDDTYIEEWHQVRGLLDSLNVRATFFISYYHALNAQERQWVGDLLADGHEIAAHSYEHANAREYCPGNAQPPCSLSDSERAEYYIEEQILTQLNAMASDGIYPRSFAYPYGHELLATTNALLDYFDYVRDASFYPNHGDAYVACGDDRFISGLALDQLHGISDAEYDEAMDDAVDRDETLVWFTHRIHYHSSGYYVGEARLRGFIERAQARGLVFRRLRDLCSWQTLGASGAPMDVHASSRPLDEVRFGDFNADGIADAFRANGRTWEVLFGQGDGFFTGSDTEHWQYLNSSNYRLNDLRLGDFDGNGITDVFRAAGGAWYISYNGDSAWVQVNSSSDSLENLRFHDFDGDGGTDVFVSSAGNWYVSYNAESSWTYLASSGYSIDSLRFGDFDGDGISDVFVSDGHWLVRYGASGSWTQINTSAIAVTELAFADVDADGRTDVMRSTGTDWLVSNGGSGPWNHLTTSEKTISEAAFADLNGDGDMEILVVDEPIGLPELECSDAFDNDGDGFTDFVGGDPGCADADDLSENDPSLPCDDGADNDSDGAVDYPGDIGCRTPTWPTENPECSDGIDNADNDDPPLADWDGADLGLRDPQCVAPWDRSESPPSRPCGLSAELALVLAPLMWLFRRRRRWT